jgi:hypothetical protein
VPLTGSNERYLDVWTRRTSCCLWTAESANNKIDDGIDTFVFKDGFVRVQAVRYALLKK